jgi:hypothetical protein
LSNKRELRSTVINNFRIQTLIFKHKNLTRTRTSDLTNLLPTQIYRPQPTFYQATGLICQLLLTPEASRNLESATPEAEKFSPFPPSGALLSWRFVRSRGKFRDRAYKINQQYRFYGSVGE